MSRKPRSSGKFIFTLVIICTVLLLFRRLSNDGQETSPVKTTESTAARALKLFGSNKEEESVFVHRAGQEYLARIFITGVIEEGNQTYNQSWLLKTIEKLKDDKDNRGIVLFINSPGGAVYQADEAYLALLDYKSSGKKIYAYMGPLAASGGYYIACAADKIFANRNTLTGSIGVIAGQFVDATGLMEKVGIKSETIHAGRNKTMGSLDFPITEEQRSIMQSIADECYEQFTLIVSKSRGLPSDKVVALADGRIYTAKQAKENGLVDEIVSYDECISSMNNDEYKSEQNPIPVEDFAYQAPETFYSYLTGASSFIRNLKAGGSFTLPKIVEDKVERKVPFPAYYYEGF